MVLAIALLLQSGAATPAVSLTLEDAWAAAARSNPQVQIAIAERTRAEDAVHEGYALFFPTVAGDATFQDNDRTVIYDVPANPLGLKDFVLQPKWTLSWQIAATENLSFHGPAIPLLRQTIAQREQARALDSQTRGDVAFAVARAYYAALAAEALSGIAADAKTAGDEELRVTRGKAEGGRATQAEVLRAEVHVAEAEQNAATARRAAIDAQETLADLIGTRGPFTLSRPPRPTPPADARLDETDTDTAAADLAPADLAPAALARRADVAAESHAVAGARYARSAAMRAFFPSLSVEGLYSGYQTSSGDLFGQSPTRYALLGIAQVPIFDGNLKYWQLREKRAALDAELAREAAVDAAAAADVRRARRAAIAAREAETLAKKRLALAEQARDLVEGQYSLGAATQLELMDADNARSAARRDATQAEYDADVAVLDLERAMGLPLGKAP